MNDRGTPLVDAADIWQLLQRGGLVLPSATSVSSIPVGESRLRKYDGLTDPSGAETLGKLLAERARPFAPGVVLLWEDPLDIVLGHVVARELEATAARAYNQEGLVELLGVLPPGRRVLIVTDAVREPTVVRALYGLAQQCGSSVVATAVLADTDALAAAGEVAGAIVSLVSLRESNREISNGTH